MKKVLLFAILVLAVVLFTAACGGTDETTTSAGAPTTATSAAPTSEGATTTGAAGETTTTAGAAQPGQFVVQLTGADMVPPVETTNTAILTLSLQGTSIMYELSATGLQPTEVTSAGIYIATEGGTTTTAAGGATTTSAAGGTTTSGTAPAAGQEGELVIDLLAGQAGTTPTAGGATTTAAGGATTTTAGATTTTSAGTDTTAAGTDTTAAGGAATVIASGTFSEQNLAGSWADRDINELLPLLAGITDEKGIWVQINTVEFPNGELRGYFDLATMIQQIMGGLTGTTDTTGTGGGSDTTGGAAPTTSSS